ncbi:protein-lysine N-methyltransferase Efm4p [Diutina rugosa]
MEDIKLNSSKLGTQEYWNNFYQKEIENFENNEEDTGECWFDDSDAENKMIQYIIDQLNGGDLNFKDSDITVLDLGTGNGHFLFQLNSDLEEEYEGSQKFHFTGIDYSPDSVAFCQKIAETRDLQGFEFKQVDLLKPDQSFLSNKFNLLVDKGTLDAIALNQEPLVEFDGRTGMEVYAEQIVQMMNADSKLLITSCNFTESELIKVITQKTNLRVWGKIDYPSFEFGGVKGATICSVVFSLS